MAPLQPRRFCAGLLLALFLRAADCVKVIVGDQFIFPVNCAAGESGKLEWVISDVPREVATCQSGQWMVSREYTDRITIHSSRIGFTDTRYTDSGTYERSGFKSDIQLIQLEVIVAWKESAAEDETATLPCYFETTGKTGLTPRWEKNGTALCVNNISSGGCSSGTSGGRFSASPDWFIHGDLTLTVERVQLEDRGDYYCYVQGQQSGDPAAVRLDVKEKKYRQITTTATPADQTKSCSEQSWKIVFGVILVLLLAVLLSGCLKRHGKLSCDSGKPIENGGIHYQASQQNEAIV